jgi:ribosomal protein L11 methylase PrmA
MYPGVLQPLSSGHFGSFLYDYPLLYKDKVVLDMGCGSGALGIIMALGGAKQVILADIDENCCNNTLENISRFGVESQLRSGSFRLV